MEYPAGYLSDEYDDEFDGFLSDHSSNSDHVRDWNGDINEPSEPTQEQKLCNLYYGIINGNLAAVIDLIDSGLNVDVELQDNWKPLILAASIGNCDIISELIARGANVNDHRDRYTVLMAVCNCPETTSSFETSLSIVEDLLNHGAEVNAITRKRETALMFAAGVGNVLIVRKLLLCCDTNARDNKGWNALFWAVHNNKLEVTQVLLEAGLDSQKPDVCGNTPLYYATMQENEDIIKILSPSNEDNWNESVKTAYNFENEFKNAIDRPQFLQDIFSMLYGMKCGNIRKFFTSVNLLDFLSMNENDLQDIGVQLPYQRNRILAGLYKFHKHLFKRKSIPIVPKDAIFSTIDIAHSVLTAIRQLTVMEASLQYILKSDRNFDVQQRKDIDRSVQIIKNKITKLKRCAVALDSMAHKWDKKNGSVDLICKKSQFRWFEIVIGSSIVVSSVFLVYKFYSK